MLVLPGPVSALLVLANERFTPPVSFPMVQVECRKPRDVAQGTGFESDETENSFGSGEYSGAGSSSH